MEELHSKTTNLELQTEELRAKNTALEDQVEEPHTKTTNLELQMEELQSKNASLDAQVSFLEERKHLLVCGGIVNCAYIIILRRSHLSKLPNHEFFVWVYQKLEEALDYIRFFLPELTEEQFRCMIVEE